MHRRIQMRSHIIALAICVSLWTGFLANAHAAGYYSVGKEDCNCSPLVARGIMPDTLNQLVEALAFPKIGWAFERLATEIKLIASQFGPKPTPEIADAIEKKEVSAEIEEPIKVEKKPVLREKKGKVKKTAKETSKKKRVKVPTRTL